MKQLVKPSEIKKNLAHFIPRILVVLIVGQTLPFKYLGAEESVWIFSQLGMEPYGRILIGVLESVAIVLLLTRFYQFGAYLTTIIVGSAFVLHLTTLGTQIQGDNGLLFMLSYIVSIASLWLVFYHHAIREKTSSSQITSQTEVGIGVEA